MTREEAIHILDNLKPTNVKSSFDAYIVGKALTMAIKALEQEPQTYKWCTGCREYDQEKHCCHRWSKVIRDTVEEMKQEYIEREVLDKIRAEIEAKCCITVGRENDGAITLYDVFEIINKYKAEIEPQESEG